MMHHPPCSYETLYTLEGLQSLHQAFQTFLAQHPVHSALSGTAEDLISHSLLIENFLVDFFKITADATSLMEEERMLGTLYTFKRRFIQRYLKPRYDQKPLPTFQIEEIRHHLSQAMGLPFNGNELMFATHVSLWLENPTFFQQELLSAEYYGAWALFTKDGQEEHKDGTLFHLPHPKDFAHLFPTVVSEQGYLKSSFLSNREGFDHTDTPCSAAFSQDQSHYCLLCHRQGKDSCRTGIEEKKSPLNEPLEGCPLGQRISEMMAVKAQGHSIAALAIITRDNPLVAATGRRICNACSAACIFQKQDPVDIPSVETQILEAVLALPWGFEIYSLLTRWNPLSPSHPLPHPPSDKKVLIAGMGPAGFALAHHLLNDGHTVVGIDGMTITPLPSTLQSSSLIRHITDFFEPLDERRTKGFGGVADYGITARWNKNFLLIIRLLLERRSSFMLLGNTRLESTLTTEQAFALGFDHVALCLGAGKPNLPTIEGLLSPGIYQAADFLMRLHVTGNAQQESGYPPLLRLPLVVIGSGLTAVDAATEALAYYQKQVEAFLKRYEQSPLTSLTPSEEEFLLHARTLRQERLQAEQDNRPPRFQELLWQWGGVTLLYRRSIQESPAYCKNSLELQKAMEEGVLYREYQTPQAFLTDQEGRVCTIQTYEGNSLLARTVLIATGTAPNTVIAEENPTLFQKDGSFLRSHLAHSPFTAGIFDKHRFISFVGDLHPQFTGSVVHALASAQKAAPIITQKLKENEPQSSLSSDIFFSFLRDQVVPKVHGLEVQEDGLSLIVHAPLMAHNFQPGNLFRLQIPVTSTTLKTIPLMGSSFEKDFLRFFIKRSSTTHPFLQSLTKGAGLPLMGPTGSTLAIPFHHLVLFLGEPFHEEMLRSLAQSFMDKGCRISCNEPLSSHYDTIVVVGSLSKAQYVINQRSTLKEGVTLLGILPGPFQCMMKGICAQCLQHHINPATGRKEILFSCQQSIQSLETLDLENLISRLQR